MTEVRRLFFALWPPQAVRQALLAQVQGRLPPDHGRRVHPADLHATLVFLGAVSAPRMPCIMEAAEGLDCGGFDLELDYLGYWKRPRVIWAGARRTPAVLTDRVRALQAHLQGCGFEPEPRPFRLHVTLARKARPIEEVGLESPVIWPVAGFALVESVSLPGQANRYEVLKTWAPGS